MFSGLGNFPDLNSTFAQLSNFSLDALQSSETDPKAAEAAPSGDSLTTVQAQVSQCSVRSQ
jgi:hypothetical protein